ncbi:MAG: glycerol-3-phosphate transporter permease [Candidatus Entotheonella factor]|uniref:sn-glycerol-3-phosphate transport system permease protein UgpA n=1 Tax=Entotheonella factor TaxID=1429438 RepID=W4LBC9_ENTF1|nr:sn-glycerol-3-phosphate ABC transporter permease UgpA [Candidatus Entotheonella palauensis]ETW94631.1 MAG: glycerol-3-phosphate transporter permease [Candidatus Entotheonella factor]
MDKRVVFQHKLLPYLLLAPQLIITLVFFIWPALQALKQSVYLEDPFGLGAQLIWFDNFHELWNDPLYLDSLWTTIGFSFAVAILALSLALYLAVQADRVARGASTYQTLLIWPYAVAPAVAGLLWYLLFNPVMGLLPYVMHAFNYEWNANVHGGQAMLMVIIAAAWKQISYNFLFFLAGMQAIPKSMIEAAAIDCAGPSKRFWTIVFPLLAPTTFFLVVINIVYAFFDTFGIIHSITSGGPAGATTTLVYKVFNDGFIGLNLGSSAAQSVILMAIVIALTVIQFRFVERRVHY